MTETLNDGLQAAESSVRPAKASGAFRTISEVADELEVAQHVLRFWESKFPQVRPLKRGGGRRYYRPEDVEVLKQIRTLLYDEGYTIKGAQRHLRGRRLRSENTPSAALAARPGPPRDNSPKPLPAPRPVPSEDTDWRVRLSELRDDLHDIMNVLERTRAGQH